MTGPTLRVLSLGAGVQAPIGRVTRHEWQARQIDLMDVLSADAITAAMDDDEAEVFGCGPHTCRVPGDPIEDVDDDSTEEITA